jgi:hypothetical protein
LAISFDGASKVITLDTALSFTVQQLYKAGEDWSVLPGNMQYLEPLESAGNILLSGGIKTDIIVLLVNGWKMKPSGYAPGTLLSITGTLVVEGGGAYAIAPTVGSPVTWFVQAATAGTIVTVTSGSGLSVAEHDQLMAVATQASVNLIPTTPAPTAAQITSAVWANPDAVKMRKIATNKKITDPITGIMTVYEDGSAAVAFTAQLWEDAAGTIKYRGQGFERIEVLA